MSVKLSDGKATGPETTLALESELGFQISDPFRRFIATHDGAKPETNIFKIDEKNESGINRFIPAEEISKERSLVETLPAKAYPVAWAEGGNYVFVNEAMDGAIFFWDHEVPEKAVKLADNLDAFLDVLRPFDAKSIELKPGQVKRVWIDPDFLKKLKNQK